MLKREQEAIQAKEKAGEWSAEPPPHKPATLPLHCVVLRVGLFGACALLLFVMLLCPAISVVYCCCTQPLVLFIMLLCPAIGDLVPDASTEAERVAREAKRMEAERLTREKQEVTCVFVFPSSSSSPSLPPPPLPHYPSPPLPLPPLMEAERLTREKQEVTCVFVFPSSSSSPSLPPPPLPHYPSPPLPLPPLPFSPTEFFPSLSSFRYALHLPFSAIPCVTLLSSHSISLSLPAFLSPI